MGEAHETIIVDMVGRLGEVTGRKKLQKMVFLLKSLGAPFPERFTYHFYGPYSEQLADEVRWLVETGQLTEVPREKASGHTEYVYRAGGEAEVARLPEVFLPLAQRMNGCEARFLELMATIQYLLLQGMDVDQAGVRARELKPDQAYTENEAEAALGVLAELERASSGAA